MVITSWICKCSFVTFTLLRAMRTSTTLSGHLTICPCFSLGKHYKCICCTKLSIYWHSNGRGPVFLQSPPHVTACLRRGGESKSCLLAGWVQPGSDQPSRIGGAAPSSHQRIHLGATCHAYCIQDGAFNCTWSNHGLC